MYVLFLSGEANESDGSRMYRCVYQSEQISRCGHASRVMYVGDATKAEIASADVVVFSRCKWEQPTVDLVLAARAAGKLVTADIDDKIFCPWDVEETGYLRSKLLFRRRVAEEARGRVLETQHAVLRLLPLFDETIVSTPAIAEELSELGLPAHVAPNAIDDLRYPPIRRERSHLRRVLFMTGTRTHDADFRMLVPVLLDFLRRHPAIELTILGPMAVPDVLSRLPTVTVRGKVPLQELFGVVAEHDLCLAPLERTSFNDCKSALKFIECGLVSVPVIASPRREFRTAIEHRKNGLLAESPSEWSELLRELAGSPELLRAIAANAHESVRREHTVSSRGSRLAEHFASKLDHGDRELAPRAIAS